MLVNEVISPVTNLIDFLLGVETFSDGIYNFRQIAQSGETWEREGNIP